MARTVSLRVSFNNDIGYLNRLSQAIEKDDRMQPGEKKACMLALIEVIQTFSRVDQRSLRGGD